MKNKKLSKPLLLIYIAASIVWGLTVRRCLLAGIKRGVAAGVLLGIVVLLVYGKLLSNVQGCRYGVSDKTRWKEAYKNGMPWLIVYLIVWPYVLYRLPVSAVKVSAYICGPVLYLLCLLPAVKSMGPVPEKPKPAEKPKLLDSFSSYQGKRDKLKAATAKKREVSRQQVKKENEKIRTQAIYRKEFAKKDRLNRYLEKLGTDYPFASFLVYTFDPLFPANTEIEEEVMYIRPSSILEFQPVTAKKAFVSNDEKLAKIHSILEESGLLRYGYMEQLLKEQDIQKLAPISTAGIFGQQRRLTTSDGTLVDPMFYEGVVQFIHTWTPDVARVINARLKYYSLEEYTIRMGLQGERAVKDVLEMHRDAFYLLSNLRLEFSKDGKKTSAETDFLVISPYGVSALEVKNYGSSGAYKLIATRDGKWYREYPQKVPGLNTQRVDMDNPFAQNDRHIAFLEREINQILNRSMDHRIFLDNIVVLANDTVDIEADLPSHQIITRPGTLYGCLTASHQKIMTVEEAETLYENLSARSLPGLPFPVLDYTDELKAMVDLWSQMKMVSHSYQNKMLSVLENNPGFLQPVE